MKKYFITFLKKFLDYKIKNKSKFKWNIRIKNLCIKKSKFNEENTNLSRNHEITYISEHIIKYFSFQMKL